MVKAGFVVRIPEFFPGIADGCYHSCWDTEPPTCQFFSRCHLGKLTTLPCPAGKQWDDLVQSCVTMGTSHTCGSCKRCSTSPPTSGTTTVTLPPTPPRPTTRGPCISEPEGGCITRCRDMCDGPYSYCGSCTEYVQCVDRWTYILTCPEHKEFDSNLKACVPHSSTWHQM